jgi:hypothetical protein
MPTETPGAGDDPETPASNSSSDFGLLMSTNQTDTTTEEYRIAVNHSSGKVADPTTGEKHAVEATSDTSGEITVSNPFSARELVENKPGLEFVDEEPTDAEVHRAQQSALGLERVPDHIVAFADKKGIIGTGSLDAASGFDPVEDQPYNDPRIKVSQAYESLQGTHQPEARFLRLLDTTERQNAFISHLRTVDGVDL